ncbi:MAG TPA: DUF2461 domain-containing protein [Paucimonas sp.]|nr:DUF2461 domain-containing protein [Paucimonas sp.]HJW57222.1 DUF2461 domain-containing protein [Burkholderiaceae bacterium]
MHVRDLARFLAELSENNNRAWFVMNQPRYDILRAEFLELIAQLIDAIGRFDPAITACDPKKALFRLHRDLRFSRDKRPYKTRFSAAITASGLKKPSQGGGPAYYFHVDADGTLLAAGGEYLPPPQRLRVIRQHIVDNAAEFGKLLKNRKLTATFGGLQEEDKLVRPPKGFNADAPHLEALKLKSFIVWKETDLAQCAPDHLARDLTGQFKDAYPLVAWLREVK